MAYLRYVFLLWAVSLMIIPFTNITIRVTYIRDDSDDELIAVVSGLFGLVNIKWETNLIRLIMTFKGGVKMEHEVEAAKKGLLIKEISSFLNYKEAAGRFPKVLRMSRRYKKAVDFLRKRMTVEELNWETWLGTGDAAVTGMLVGLMWVLKTAAISVLDIALRSLTLGAVEVVPCFKCAKFKTKFDCILRFKIGHAIIASFIIIAAIIKDGDTYERAPD